MIDRLIAAVRPMLPPEARVLGNRLRPSNRQVRKRVDDHMDVPASLARSRRRRGSVWGVTMMRNEIDTARPVIEHLFAQGVDAILVADNNSDDGTSDILADLAASLPVHVVRDRLTAYEQGPKMTALAELARDGGADWIVPFDADELWFATEQPLATFLRTCDASVVRAEMHNVFPGPGDDPNEPNPFRRLRHIDPAPAEFSKVAFRSAAMFRVAMGNLEVIRRGRRRDGLFVAHYPWRSRDHMLQKLRHGRLAMEATNLGENQGYHWRDGGAWPEEQIDGAWVDLTAGRPVEALCWSPLGHLVEASPGSWQDWSLR